MNYFKRRLTIIITFNIILSTSLLAGPLEHKSIGHLKTTYNEFKKSYTPIEPKLDELIHYSLELKKRGANIHTIYMRINDITGVIPMIGYMLKVLKAFPKLKGRVKKVEKVFIPINNTATVLWATIQWLDIKVADLIKVLVKQEQY